MKISLSAKAGIVKGSRVAVRQGHNYWIATVTRKGANDVSVQYDEGTKGTASMHSLTHLSDSLKITKKPISKEQLAVLKDKMKAVSAKSTKTPVAKTPVAKTPVNKETLDPTHEGTVVRLKNRDYVVAYRRVVRGGGSTELTLQALDDGNIYKLKLRGFDSTNLTPLRRATPSELDGARAEITKNVKSQMEREDNRYEKAKDLGVSHESIGDYALIKFSNGAKWVKIAGFDGKTSRIGIQGSGSRLRYVDPKHVLEVSPTTSSNPTIQASAKLAKKTISSIESIAGLYNPIAKFQNTIGPQGSVSKRGNIGMLYVQRVREYLLSEGFKLEKTNVYLDKTGMVTVSLQNIGDSFSVTVSHNA